MGSHLVVAQTLFWYALKYDPLWQGKYSSLVQDIANRVNIKFVQEMGLGRSCYRAVHFCNLHLFH